MSFKEELKELYENHSGKAMEAALGVGVRSIQNYLKDINPTMPSRETIADIHELYANYKAGKGLVRNQQAEQATALKPTVESLSRSIEKSNDARLIEADNIRRLISLLESNFHKQSSEKEEKPATKSGVEKAANQLKSTGRTGPYFQPRPTKRPGN